jgi:hypothetical protein
MDRLVRFAAWTALVALTCGAQSAAAQTKGPAGPTIPHALPASSAGAIHGVVTDERGVVVRGAVVSALGTSLATAETDQHGRFVLRDLHPATYSLRAHLPGVSTSRAVAIEVHANQRSLASITLARLSPALAGVGTAGRGDLFASTLDADEAQGADADSGQSPTTETAEDDHSGRAWRIRHGRRSILKDLDSVIDLVEAEYGTPDGGSFFGRAMGSARSATSLLADVAWSGEVNLLTTTSFDAPRDLFDADALPRGVAYLSLGAPAGGGKWAVQGAMTQGDVSSWIVAGSYSSLFRGTHAVQMGLSYSTQRYDLGNPAAVAASSDHVRSVGEIAVGDDWKIAPRATLSYGARYARYDYLAPGALFSPRAALTLDLSDRSRVSIAGSQSMLAPGAEEFLPPTIPGLWLPPERTFSMAAPEDPFRPERTQLVAIGFEQDLTDEYSVGVRRFYQAVDDQLVTLFGVRMPGGPSDALGHYLVAAAGNVESEGWIVSFKCDLTDRVQGTVEYSAIDARWAPSPDAALLAAWAPSALRRGHERLHDVTTAVETSIPETATRFFVLYRLNSGFAQSARDGVQPAQDSRFDVRVHQALTFLPFTNTQWELLVAVRNFFREGVGDGSPHDELLVVDPPKRIVGGLLVRF